MTLKNLHVRLAKLSIMLPRNTVTVLSLSYCCNGAFFDWRHDCCLWRHCAQSKHPLFLLCDWSWNSEASKRIKHGGIIGMKTNQQKSAFCVCCSSCSCGRQYTAYQWAKRVRRRGAEKKGGYGGCVLKLRGPRIWWCPMKWSPFPCNLDTLGS